MIIDKRKNGGRAIHSPLAKEFEGSNLSKKSTNNIDKNSTDKNSTDKKTNKIVDRRQRLKNTQLKVKDLIKKNNLEIIKTFDEVPKDPKNDLSKKIIIDEQLADQQDTDMLLLFNMANKSEVEKTVLRIEHKIKNLKMQLSTASTLSDNKKKLIDTISALKDKLLELNGTQNQDKINQMESSKKKILDIIKPLGKEEFKQTIDLTGKPDKNDPTTLLLSGSREFFKTQRYEKAPAGKIFTIPKKKIPSAFLSKIL